jgi:ankyrin repeat protein
MFIKHLKSFLYVVVLMAYSSAMAGSYEDFFSAIDRDDGRSITALLQRGFDPNSLDSKGQLGIVLALQDGGLNAADALMSSPAFKVDTHNSDGETALMIAALKGRLDICKRLLAMGATVQQPGWSPLHYAASGPDPEVVALILSKGAPIDALSPNGSTPLMMAAQYGSIDGAILLLTRGADPTLRNAAGWTAADFAQQADRDRLAQMIDDAAARKK